MDHYSEKTLFAKDGNFHGTQADWESYCADMDMQSHQEREAYDAYDRVRRNADAWGNWFDGDDSEQEVAESLVDLAQNDIPF